MEMWLKNVVFLNDAIVEFIRARTHVVYWICKYLEIKTKKLEICSYSWKMGESRNLEILEELFGKLRMLSKRISLLDTVMFAEIWEWSRWWWWRLHPVMTIVCLLILHVTKFPASYRIIFHDLSILQPKFPAVMWLLGLRHRIWVTQCPHKLIITQFAVILWKSTAMLISWIPTYWKSDHSSSENLKSKGKTHIVLGRGP